MTDEEQLKRRAELIHRIMVVFDVTYARACQVYYEIRNFGRAK